MANKGALALAVAVGYVLGRHHKLRLATALVVAGVTRDLRKGDGGLLKQGVKSLGASPQLEEITSRLRTELMDVGKAAAIAATSRQIELVQLETARSSRIAARADPAARRGTRRPSGRRGARGRAEDEYEEEPPTDEAPPERPRTRRERPPAAPVRRAGR